MNFAAGDMCVVIRGPEWTALDEAKHSRFIGRTCVLVYRTTRNLYGNDAPFWQTSGLDAEVSVVAECALRKIPPAPMEIETDEREAVV